jgi:phosphatidylserine/phosphatidylglycerophosphate/cardiolipin synthase-like enzyme
MRTEFEYIEDEQIYQVLMRNWIPRARRSVLVVTAITKQTTIELGAGGQAPFIELVDHLLGRGISVSILIAGKPSQPFLASLARYPRVLRALRSPVGGPQDSLVRLCIRNHMKIVLVDGEKLYLGSANLSGAGMGRKKNEERNFEFGLLTTDPRQIATVGERVRQIWQGELCSTCKKRQECTEEHTRVIEAMNTAIEIEGQDSRRRGG